MGSLRPALRFCKTNLRVVMFFVTHGGSAVAKGIRIGLDELVGHFGSIKGVRTEWHQDRA
jgi:hypothetical protein